MKMNRTTTGMVLGLALLVCAQQAIAEEPVDLPAQNTRIWAPVGDVIGLQNNWTGTFQAKDPHGNWAKGAEDWQLYQQYSGGGLFGYFMTKDSGKRYWLRASGDNAGTGGMRGKIDLGGNSPGKYNWDIDYRGYQYFYDETSEMRSSTFQAPPPPPELGTLPQLDWRRMNVGLNVRLSDKFDLGLGYRRKCREGTKGSLLRGQFNDGSAVPGVKSFSTTSNEILGGIGFATGGFGSELDLSYRTTEGDRALEGQHSYADDQNRFQGSLGLSYAFSGEFRLIGRGTMANLKNTGTEGIETNTYSVDGQTKTSGGHLGLVGSLGRAMDLSIGANFRSLNTDAQTDLGADVQQATDRKRSSQDYRLNLAYTGLKKTLLRLAYRYGTSDLDQTNSLGDVPGGSQITDYQVIDQQKSRQSIDLRGRYRFSRAASLRAMVGWSRLEIKQDIPGDSETVEPLIYEMGDRNRDRFTWDISLRSRPWKKVRLDLGHQSIDQTYERLDMAQSETKWKANRGYANLNWLTSDALTIYAMFSYGTEKYTLVGDPTPMADMNAIAYDGTTSRFTPGATLSPAKDLLLEAYWEGIWFEDKGNDDVIRVLNSDVERFVVRAGYRIIKDTKLTLSLTRNEFDENRWDDYIQYLYAASVSGTF